MADTFATRLSSPCVVIHNSDTFNASEFVVQNSSVSAAVLSLGYPEISCQKTIVLLSIPGVRTGEPLAEATSSERFHESILSPVRPCVQGDATPRFPKTNVAGPPRHEFHARRSERQFPSNSSVHGGTPRVCSPQRTAGRWFSDPLKAVRVERAELLVLFRRSLIVRISQAKVDSKNQANSGCRSRG